MGPMCTRDWAEAAELRPRAGGAGMSSASPNLPLTVSSGRTILYDPSHHGRTLRLTSSSVSPVDEMHPDDCIPTP